jgi:ABC-2 type transport system ATP-binding protein
MIDQQYRYLINAQNVQKNYGKIWALKDFNLKLKPKETIGLLGPNGAGKTTAIHILMGILSPSKGDIKVLGYNPELERGKLASKINFTSAYVELPSNLTVLENLKIFSGLYEINRPQEKISELLELFHLENFKDRLFGWLSAGEKTRVNLCKCFLNDPELLLLDEPTASLDPEMADKVRSTLKKIQQDRDVGMIYTSHNMNEVEEMCDEVVFLNKGEILAKGDPLSLKNTFNAKDLESLFIKLVRESL